MFVPLQEAGRLQGKRAHGYAHAKRQLLHGGVHAGCLADELVGNLGVGDRIQRRELQRADASADAAPAKMIQCGVLAVNSPITATLPSPSKSGHCRHQDRSGIRSIRRKHLDSALDEQSADGRGAGQHSGLQRAHSETQLQHQRQQQRDRADPMRNREPPPTPTRMSGP